MFFILALTMLQPCWAQRGRNTNTAQEETPGQRQFKTMLPSTAKVMFIDSIVVAKRDFINYIPLNVDAGAITAFNDVFVNAEQFEGTVYSNEYNDRRIFAKGDSVASHLYSSDLLGTTWGEARQLDELEDELDNLNYPFLMADGITLFFAAKGESSLGGYDIYMTLFDSESGQYYKPENYGLPFSSTANDYMVTFSETDSLGWLVSDRYQPADSVCIYTFVPTFPRKSFSEDELSDVNLPAVAQLKSISMTWQFGNYSAALTRYHNMMRSRQVEKEDKKVSFVINDNVIYHSENDFKSQEARRLFKQLEELQHVFATDSERLDVMRKAYHDAGVTIRNKMRDELLRTERIVEQEQRDIKNLEKQIRQAESIN